MIRVRYQDSSSGSHHGTGLYGTAKRCPQGVTIYLVPGLTGRQRQAVIRRLRQEASRGCGPELPLPGLLVALGADRVRVAVKLTAAAVRLHPATMLLPTGLVAAGMLLLCAHLGRRQTAARGRGRAGQRQPSGVGGPPGGRRGRRQRELRRRQLRAQRPRRGGTGRPGARRRAATPDDGTGQAAHRARLLRRDAGHGRAAQPSCLPPDQAAGQPRGAAGYATVSRVAARQVAL